MEIVLILVVSALNIVCFFVGAKVGQTVSREEKIELPTINPLQLYREHQDKKQADKEQDEVATIMRNIERYDGTSNGQEDIPKG